MVFGMNVTVRDADLLAVAQSYAAQPDSWPVAPRFNPSQRWYYRMGEYQDHEVWLLTWLAGQHTELHDHGGSAGAFVVVSGELTEQSMENVLVENTFQTGQGRRFDGHHVHRLANQARRPAVSVHVYGPALSSMTRYQFEGGTLTATAIDRAGAQW